MDRKTSARVAALASWEQSREKKLLACAKGGAAHKRSHMVSIGAWRQGPVCEGGVVPGNHIAADGRAACPDCGKRVKVRRHNRTYAHKEAKAA